MNPRKSTQPECFFGTLEQCVEQYGGKARFTVSDPLTFFSGARMETHRRAQSNDGDVVIIEQQFGPTVCEVYRASAALRSKAAYVGSVQQSQCA